MESEEKRALLVLLRLDSGDLFKRVRDRKEEYIGEFSLKRTREHFKDIFYTRYFDISIDQLKFFSEDLLVTFHDFYDKVEELKWYLNHTQDMTAQVTEIVDGKMKLLQKLYDRLKLHIDAELND